MISNKDKIDHLIELLRDAEVDRRDISDVYDLYQYVSLSNALFTAETLFNEKGFSGPSLEELGDMDYVLE